jgi:AraC-like DNA-binding protein
VFHAAAVVDPKTWCQLARFRATLAWLRAGHPAQWAAVAAESGYADQSHMIADFRRFTGLT